MIRFAALLFFVCSCAAVPDITYIDGGDNTCPNVVPSFATMCCGSVPCNGAGCVAACNDCATSCAASDLCCPNAQSHAVCKPNLQCQ